MKQRVFSCVGVLIILGLGLRAQSVPGSILIKTGTLIVDTTQAPMAHGEVLIEDGRVMAVGRDLTVPAGTKVLDLSQDTVMPSLLDAHTHLAGGSRGATPSAALSGIYAARDVEWGLEQGVAAMRVLGTNDFMDVAAAQAVEAGTIPGPHVIPAGHAISIPGGHADFLTMSPSTPLLDYYTPMNGFINSVGDAEAAVHWQVKYGAKVIKIMASGGVLSPTDLFTSEQLTPEEMAKIVEVAHGDNLKVAAHDENLKAIRDAVHAGVDSIEHGSDMDDVSLAYMKAHNQVYDATLYVVDNLLENGARMQMPDYVMTKVHELSVKHFASFGMALRSGVEMAAGSDQAYGPGAGTIYNEVVAEVAHGATPKQALTDATQHNAALLGLPKLGTLAVGQEGDLVAMPGNPLEDIHAVSHLRTVVYQGRVVLQ